MVAAAEFSCFSVRYSSAGAPRGVVLLTHGMNGSPASLDPFARVLTAAGFEVFRPSFTGHRGNNQELLAVKSAQWEADARRFHAEAEALATNLAVPLHHVGYSMTGLIFQGLRDELPFDRRVYLAPALAFHFWYGPALAIARAIPWLQFGSRIPGGYNAHPRSGARPSIALDDFWRNFQRKDGGAPDQVPTLIWADLGDELVNAEGLRALAKRSPAWEFRELSTKGGTMKYHHLCLDERCLGAEEWVRVTGESIRFLSEK